MTFADYNPRGRKSMAPYFALVLALATSLAACSSSNGENEDDDDTVGPHWRSILYPEDWAPDHTLADGRFLHDFSYAGYRAGEEPIPSDLPEPVLSVLDEGADPTGESDSTQAIQATIDALDDGGTAYIQEGLYRVEGELIVSTDGVVIAGDGRDSTFVHFTREHDTDGASGLWYRGEPPGEGEWPLAEDAGRRARRVRVIDSSGLSAGDSVALGIVITDAFREEHGMQERWGFSADAWRAFARRTVAAVEGNEIVLDVPVRYPAKVRDHASLRSDEGYLTEVGLFGLALSTVVSEEAAMAVNRHHAVTFQRVRDGWISSVRSFQPAGAEAHLQSGGILIERSRKVTIADAVLGHAQNRGGGGNGYLFEISRSNEVLIRDATGEHGRHNFIQNWDFGTSGCVFLRTTSRGGAVEGIITTIGYSEYHHALAHANLVDDSVAHDGWEAKNRHGYSSGAGHTATECVFWNVRGEGHLWSMQYEMGYVIGTGPELTVHTDLETLDLMQGAIGTEPEDHAEGIGEAEWLLPQSLYEDQLARRLGGGR